MLFIAVLWWFIKLIPHLVFLAISYPAALFLPAFAGADAHLPKWLSWFDQPDDDLDGDNGWKTEHRWFKDSLKVDHGWRRYINRVRWLWRNPAYNWGIEVMGFIVSANSTRETTGNAKVSDRPLSQGFYFTVIRPNSKLKLAGWFYYGVWQWCGRFCLSIKLGYKLWQNVGSGYKCQFVVSVNPFASFKDE